MKKIYLILVVLSVLVSCTDKFEELNTDTKNPSAIPGEPLFTNATRNMVDYMQSINVNNNVFRLYAQYWAQTTYPDESQYNMVTRKNPDNWWARIYRDVLKDYQESAKIITAGKVIPGEENIQANKLAIISIMEVYAYSTLVDLFGDVPYTQALDPENVLPVYDDAKTVYNSIIDKLDAAIADLDEGATSFSSIEDLVYGGDVAQWNKFANSLKLRLAMRIADDDATKAATMATQAAPNVFSSNADNFSMEYFSDPPNTNIIWVDLVQGGRLDFVGSNTFVDQLNAWNDPRIAVFFQEVSAGGYLGGIYGDANAASGFSHVGTYFENPSLPGTIMNYAEVEFLLAEAVARGITAVGGTAESHYSAGISASMDEYGLDAADFTTYYAQPEITYATATGTWREVIGKQKWISLVNNGFEGWTTWRLMDFPGFNPPPGMTAADIPTRFIYPITEAQYNPSNLDAAKAKYNNDSPTAKIFWDKF